MADQALIFSGRGWFAQPLLNGAVGSRRSSAWTARCGLGFTIARAGIIEIDVVADSERLRRVHLAVLND
ncbi:hypothetical protein [Bradyrhizobium sp. Cp5.3]|uniref:hypothetical protein n=1 Tax=Bradyrhizobium sp. Cp5.3 TaxID=443598 RepID=UPI0004803D69|nr:hypothetical protein [Bradyrhizobium sp. Cp5.3]